MTLRDTAKENVWFNYPIIGYVPLDENGEPYRAARSGYYSKPKNGYHPPRIYKNIDLASRMSPVDSAAEVRMFRAIYKEDDE